MAISPVGLDNSSSYYSGISSGTPNTQSNTGLPTQNSINLQLDASLLQSLSGNSSSSSGTAELPTNTQQAAQDEAIIATNSNVAQLVSQLNTAPLDLPTNLQQTAQDEVILATNTNVAQEVSQATLSEPMESDIQALQTLPSSTQSDQSLPSLAASMQVLQDITNSGALASNSSLVNALMQNYNALINPTSLGSLVDTSA